MGSSRPALANILIGDATDPVCESVFRSRGHTVDFKPGMSKVCVCLIFVTRCTLVSDTLVHEYLFLLMILPHQVRSCVGGFGCSFAVCCVIGSLLSVHFHLQGNSRGSFITLFLLSGDLEKKPW